MDEHAALQALSPLDGRYARNLDGVSDYFSEFGLIRYRLRVEVAYLIALGKLGLKQMPKLSADIEQRLLVSIDQFSIDDALKVKEFEKITNHDVKALEYFMHQKLGEWGVENLTPWVHFCLTSQDINNTAIPLSLKEFVEQNYLPLLNEAVSKLRLLANEWSDIALLARTHGQPASPTRLGKEMGVFVERLEAQRGKLAELRYSGKFGGATGNFNAHAIAYPDEDWPGFADELLQRLGLQRQQTTTQIEQYDGLTEALEVIARINTILLDLCRDMWSYISFNYFRLALKEGEVGSSAMPHKVNPIDFENAEGNIGLANAVLAHLAAKLPVSRMQRDLSDSTVLRSLGVPMGHSVLALKSCLRGLGKCVPNEAQIREDLMENAVVIAEAYQVILRREGVANGYDLIKGLTRTNARPTLEDMQGMIDQFPVSEAVKEELRAITPLSYTGLRVRF